MTDPDPRVGRDRLLDVCRAASIPVLTYWMERSDEWRSRGGVRLTADEAGLALGWNATVEQDRGVSSNPADPERDALVEKLRAASEAKP